MLYQSQAIELQRMESATLEHRDNVDSPKDARLEPEGGPSDVMKKPGALVQRTPGFMAEARSEALIVSMAVEAFTKTFYKPPCGQLDSGQLHCVIPPTVLLLLVVPGVLF